jgi:hypothetical protein
MSKKHNKRTGMSVGNIFSLSPGFAFTVSLLGIFIALTS